MVLRTGNNGLARHAEDDDVSRLLSLWGIPLDDVDDGLLLERIVLCTIALQLQDMLLKRTHLLLIAQHFNHVSAGHDAQFRIKRLNQLHISVVHSIEDDGVNLF